MVSVQGMVPGWCGDTDRVRDIAQELQARKVGRGNIAQLRNQENTMIKALEAEPWRQETAQETQTRHEVGGQSLLGWRPSLLVTRSYNIDAVRNLRTKMLKDE